MLKYAKLKKLNKSMVSTGLATGVVASAFVGYTYLPNNNSVYATDYRNDNPTYISSNYNFEETGSDSVWSPNTFDAIDPNNIGESDSVKAGVIDSTVTSVEDYEETYGLTEQEWKTINQGLSTDSSDNGRYHQLMINSEESIQYGFETKSFDLNPNSYYVISVYAKVLSSQGGFGTIVLDGLSNTQQSNSIRIYDTSWDTYSFFVSTGANQKETVKLQLWLGSPEETSLDTVLFNKINFTEYSEDFFKTDLNVNMTSSPNKTLSIDLEQYDNITAPFDNADFSTNLTTGWSTITTTVDTIEKDCNIYDIDSTYPQELKDLGITNPTVINSATTPSALLMYNKEDTAQGLKSNSFKISRDNIYRVSVWAKSDCQVGNGATIKLVSDHDSEVVANQTVATSITSNPTFADWSQYNFYIKGNSTANQFVHLELWLGTEDAKTSGYVWFDDITIQQVTYTEYSNPLGTHQTLNLDTNNTTGIKNSNFTSVNNTTLNNIAPLAPSNWTLTSSDEDFDKEKSMSGVINTNSNLFSQTIEYLKDMEYYTELTQLPLTPSENSSVTTTTTTNKVLMIANGNLTTSQTYTSDQFEVSANSYNRINFQILTQSVQASENSGVTIAIKNGDKTIYQYSGIASEGTWTQYSAYIAAGSSSSNYTIEVTLDNSTGYAFFDNITLTTFDDASKMTLDYDNADIDNKKKIDQTSTLFTNYVDNDFVTDGYYDPFDWTFATKNNPENATIHAGVKDQKLTIYAGSEVYSTYTYDNDYSFDADSYYQLSVTIKTSNMGQSDIYTKTDESGNVYQYGASINLSNIGTFDAIITEGYKTYTFFIAPNTSTTSTLSISLGSENAFTYGNVQVQDITLTKLADKTEFDSLTDSIDGQYNMIINNIQTPEEDTDEDTTTTNPNNDLRLDLVIPSVLMALALLIALIGTILRRVRIHKRPKIKTSYDRRKTIELEMNKQERIELRRNIINDLNTEILAIDEEIEAMKKEFDILTKESKTEHAEIIAGYEAEKTKIETEHKDAVSQYKEKIKSLNNDEEKAKAEKQFAKYIRHLQDKESAIAKKLEIKDDKTALLEAKRELQIKKHLERKLLLQQEIEQIELEIEAIAREEEEMWSEYRKAKEMEKEEKLLYRAEKKKFKQKQKAAKTKEIADDQDKEEQ